MPSSRQLAAIMFTGIVGYTAFMGNDEQKVFDLLKKNRELQKPVIEQFNGTWIKDWRCFVRKLLYCYVITHHFVCSLLMPDTQHFHIFKERQFSKTLFS